MNTRRKSPPTDRPHTPRLPILAAVVLIFSSLTNSCEAPGYGFYAAELPPIDHPSTALRVIALGDAGTGGLPDGGNQRLVADDLALRAAPPVGSGSPVDFVLYLGDNFYENGVTSVTDPLWEAAFTDIYDFTLLPLFYVVAGNHDYGGNVQAQVDFSGLNPHWVMPAPAYSVTYTLNTAADIHFIGIDTNILLDGGTDAELHWDWIAERLSAVSGGNIIVFGHHPVYSAGYHGDNPVLVDRLRPLLEAHGADLYLAGHDHNLEIREPAAGVTYVISGSGGKLRSVTAEAESLYAAEVPGAVILDLDSAGFTLTARDSSAGLDVVPAAVSGTWMD